MHFRPHLIAAIDNILNQVIFTSLLHDVDDTTFYSIPVLSLTCIFLLPILVVPFIVGGVAQWLGCRSMPELWLTLDMCRYISPISRSTISAYFGVSPYRDIC